MARLQDTNLPVDLEQNTSDEKTQSFFNGYFDVPLNVPPSTTDAVRSFFLREVRNEEAANALAHSVITIAYENQVEPMDIIEEFQQQEGIAVTDLMAALINRTRRDTSLIGIKEPRLANANVARNILP